MSAILKGDTPDFFLELGQLSGESTCFLAPSFERLPESLYKDGQYRLRRFSHFNFTDGQLIQLTPKDFLQSAKVNSFQGNVDRHYEEIEQSVIESDAFIELFQHFKRMAKVVDDAEIDVHQIRIRAKQGEKVPVAPEGVHQDGFDIIGIYFIQRDHLKRGGNLRVHTDKDSKAFIDYQFDHGEFVILNDRRFWHSASSIVPEDGLEEGHLDAFVLTA